MSNRSVPYGRALNALDALAVVLGLLAALAALPPPARAGPCDQVGGVITGDWTISSAQVCEGILYTVDGSVTINSGGSLTLRNGGLRFAKDAFHAGYALTVNAGGELVLDNSLVTTETEAIAPYVKLALTVNGRFVMTNGAELRFPGWFNATGATIEATDSTITGFTSADLQGLGLYQDDNDDSPVIDWASSSVTLQRSRIERVYENASAAGNPNATGIIEADIVLRSASNLYAYDSYLGVDFSNVLGLHNELTVDATSNAYLYGVTIDRTQDPVSKSEWRTPYRPLAGGGSIYLLRWLHVTAVDSTAFPIGGVGIDATLSPSLITAQYPDNSLQTTPSARTLAYLGRSSTNWDVTDATGVAVLPLWTDTITTATLPNAESFGNYRIDLSFTKDGTTYTTTGGASFHPYPAIEWGDHNAFSSIPFSGVSVRTDPDLALEPADYAPRDVGQGQQFAIDVTIYNRGQQDAVNFELGAYLDGDLSPTARVGQATGITVPALQALTQPLAISGIGVLGTHSITLFADSGRAIDEGGTAQENNNFVNVTVNVGPPQNGYIALLSPNPGQSVEPGTTLTVSGYVRDQDATGLVGIPLTIELRSDSGLVTSTTVTSQSLGYFSGSISVPDNVAEGSYRVVVSPSAGPITPDSRSVEVRRAVSFLNTPILGIAVWLWLIIIIGAAAAIGGGTAYVKFVGLGKVVECGECGAFIPRDSAKCPKCGVEFEKDMAKCSNCETWIPVAVKQCPECGVEFSTGEVEIKDYEAQMRAQYEQVKRRFREEASRELGRALSDREFEDWWRLQPTFVTFEGWLREEEDMRRMGSKPCPVCNTLNSVTATVCHKCGSLMGPDTRRAPAPARAARPQTPVPTQPVPPKAPPMGAPVVQKKVIRAPEGQEGQVSEDSGGESGGDQKPEG